MRERSNAERPVAETQIVPHNIEAEQAVLGAVFIEPACLAEVSLVVKTPEMFYRASHQHIYRAILDLSARGAEIDWVHVTEEVRRRGGLEACGGAETLTAYLSEISHAVPSAYGAEGYASMVRDRYVMREIMHTAGEIRSMALEETRTPGEVIDRLERKVFELAAARYHGETHNFMELLSQVIAQQQQMKEWRMSHNADRLPGLSSGYSDLDQMTTGWKGGELIVVGARPGQGKTSLALNIAENVALTTQDRREDGKGGVLLFSLEMTGTEIVQRILCARAGVDLRAAKLGVFRGDDEARLNEAKNQLATAQVYIDDSFTLNLSEIRSKSRRLKERADIELIIVDYLQLVKDNERLDRHLQIGNISRGLKALARELDVPVIAAAQLNRGVEQRSTREKKPMLADLRESGSIEQDADQVIMLYPLQGTEGEGPQPSQDSYPVDLIVAKNRNGPTGDVHMVFNRRFTRFELAARVPTHFARIPQA
ncbi:MAG: replicative DNA helicase [Planctomycetota bacterium]|nr:MAG: replicative DNA helicase [Planctomycetota bacterium]